MIRITSINLKLGSGFEAFMKKALSKKAEKFKFDAGDPEVVVRKEGIRFKVEIKCAYCKKFLFVSDVADNAKRAFFGAMDKLSRQFEKIHDKRTDYMGRVDKEEIATFA